MTAKAKPDYFLNKFFHSFRRAEDGCMVARWQGQIVASAGEGRYVVQLYEWLIGSPTDTVFVTLDQMVEEEWVFYEEQEDWNNAIEYGLGKAGASRRHWDQHIEKTPFQKTKEAPSEAVETWH